MASTLSLVKDVRDCMTRFDPLTPEIFAIQSEGDLTYDELKKALYDCGMDIEKVVFDGSRSYQNAFFADFEQGHYCWVPFQKNPREVISAMDQQFHSPKFGEAWRNHDWMTFYMMDVPLPMQIWNFERRYQTIELEQIFSVWSYLHTHIDYANGMWKPEVLDYVFSHAPQTEHSDPDENGMITIYRGMGEKSLPVEDAISWSTDPVCALWFANRSARGTRLVFARVTPEQILIYFSLLHDIGRDSEDEDESHGDKSVELIRKKNIRIKGIQLSKKGYRIAKLLIRHHCRDDDPGIDRVTKVPNYTAKDIVRALRLYRIAKGMDGLDRVRFNGLDFRYLRTPYARQLPLVAGGLLEEPLLECVKTFVEKKGVFS
ncbi:MAG: hypothetical protein MR828_12600 [Clostridiales bacterium]|nr:hypothetical protein [Clostridiales bacterium]